MPVPNAEPREWSEAVVDAFFEREGVTELASSNWGYSDLEDYITLACEFWGEAKGEELRGLLEACGGKGESCRYCGGNCPTGDPDVGCDGYLGDVNSLYRPQRHEQELPVDHPDAVFMFQPSDVRPVVATQAAVKLYGTEIIGECLTVLQRLAVERRGLDYLQVFSGESWGEALWFIEDVFEGDGGVITALLPSDY